MPESRKSKFIFIVKGRLRMDFKEQDDAQHLLDGLTIKYVHI
jgi:hypothetical protein